MADKTLFVTQSSERFYTDLYHARKRSLWSYHPLKGSKSRQFCNWILSPGAITKMFAVRNKKHCASGTWISGKGKDWNEILPNPHIDTWLSDSSAAYPGFCATWALSYLSTDTHTRQLSTSTGLQPHPGVTTTSGILLTPPERKIWFCSVARLSSLHRRERSRSLGNEVQVFCILSGEVCKEPRSQATRKRAVLFLPLKYFQLQLHQAGRQDKGGHAESMCRSHMLHSEPRLFPLKTERVHSHVSRGSIYILINWTQVVYLNWIRTIHPRSTFLQTKDLSFLKVFFFLEHLGSSEVPSPSSVPISPSFSN